MEELLRHLMNCGLIIYELTCDTPKFAIEKLPTPLDGRNKSDFPDDTFNVIYDNFELAIKKGQELAKWQPVSPPQMWNVQIMCQHRGRGVILLDLAPVVHEFYEGALEQARLKADQYVVQKFAKGEIKKWEVKIRPCGILREAKTIR